MALQTTFIKPSRGTDSGIVRSDTVGFVSSQVLNREMEGNPMMWGAVEISSVRASVTCPPVARAMWLIRRLGLGVTVQTSCVNEEEEYGKVGSKSINVDVDALSTPWRPVPKAEPKHLNSELGVLRIWF